MVVVFDDGAATAAVMMIMVKLRWVLWMMMMILWLLFLGWVGLHEMIQTLILHWWWYFTHTGGETVCVFMKVEVKVVVWDVYIDDMLESDSGALFVLIWVNEAIWMMIGLLVKMTIPPMIMIICGFEFCFGLKSWSTKCLFFIRYQIFLVAWGTIDTEWSLCLIYFDVQHQTYVVYHFEK